MYLVSLVLLVVNLLVLWCVRKFSAVFSTRNPVFFPTCYDCHSRHLVCSSHLHWESYRSKDQCLQAVRLSHLLMGITSVFLCYNLFCKQVTEDVNAWRFVRDLGFNRPQWVGWQFVKDGVHRGSQDLPAVSLQWASLGARAWSKTRSCTVNILWVRTAWGLTGRYLRA